MPLSELAMASKLFEQAIERGTGMSIGEIRQTPIEELRRIAEKRLGHSLQFLSVFPWAGRGNVLRDRLVSRKEIDADLDDALRHL